MYNIRVSTRFQKDLKRARKRGYDMSLLADVIRILAAGQTLPEKYRDHFSPAISADAGSAT